MSEPLIADFKTRPVGPSRLTSLLHPVTKTLCSWKDFDTILKEVAWLTVKEFADICMVHLVHDNGSLHELAFAKSSIDHSLVVQEIYSRQSLLHGILMRVAGTKQPYIQYDTNASDRNHVADLGSGAHLLSFPGIASYMIYPLVHRNTWAILTFLMAGSGRIFTQDHVSIAEDLVRRVAFSLEASSVVDLSATAMNTMDEGMIAVDTRGKVVLVNQVAERLLGYTIDELLETDFRSITGPDWLLGDTPDSELPPGPLLHLETTFRRKNGTILAATFNYSPYQVGRNLAGAVITFWSPATLWRKVMSPRAKVGMPDQLELEGDLREDLFQGRLHLEYQPIVDINTSRVTSLEALVRWQHRVKGNIAPSDFIPLAERTGLILPLGRWVMREACRQLQAWRTSDPTLQALTINVNISAVQLSQASFVGEVAQVLEEMRLDPGAIQLELTETAVIPDAKIAVETLHDLKRLGVRLAIDDFGVGYSSLSYLCGMPVDTVKIDRSFIQQMESNRRASAIVRASVTFTNEAGLALVAEGVETAEQVEILRSMNCPYAQGFYFGRPARVDIVESLLMTTV